MPGTRVLDVAAGTGNASIPAARAAPTSTASDLTPELLEAGRTPRGAAGVEFEWVEADAEHLPFEDESFDVVMSAIGVDVAPTPRTPPTSSSASAPGRHDRAPELDARGDARCVLRTMNPFVPPPPPGAQPPPLWGGEEHLRGLFGDRVGFRTMEREVSRSPRSSTRTTTREHFKDRYGPTIAARANAASEGREAEFDAALDGSATSGTAARPSGALHQEYLHRRHTEVTTGPAVLCRLARAGAGPPWPRTGGL